jgi:glucarate dehydratase
MKIASIEAIPVSIPATRTCTWAFGRSYGHTRTVVRVLTEDGLTGWGEAPGDGSAAVIAQRLAPRLVGANAFERETALRLCRGEHRDFGYLADPAGALAFAGIEIALWDLLGKATGQPIFRLLGGPVRDQAPFVSYAYTVALEEGHALADVPGIMADIAQRSIAASGACAFEFKIGRHPVETDIATVHAVRAALGPKIDLAVDANLGMGIDKARRFLAGAGRELADIEEPVARLDDMQRLRADFGVPISTHCTDFEKIKHYPGIDNLVGDLNVDGGLGGCMRAAAIAAAIGKRFWLRSNGETGIGWAALSHFGIACPEADRPAQSLIDWCEDDLIDGPVWHVRDGGVRPPEKPGLGIEIDQDSLARYAERYRKNGPFTRFDAS